MLEYIDKKVLQLMSHKNYKMALICPKHTTILKVFIWFICFYPVFKQIYFFNFLNSDLISNYILLKIILEINIETYVFNLGLNSINIFTLFPKKASIIEYSNTDYLFPKSNVLTQYFTAVHLYGKH
jgi:hypothetical protein